MRAIHKDEIVASAAGIHCARTKMIAFVMSAVWPAVFGAIWFGQRLVPRAWWGVGAAAPGVGSGVAPPPGLGGGVGAGGLFVAVLGQFGENAIGDGS